MNRTDIKEKAVAIFNQFKKYNRFNDPCGTVDSIKHVAIHEVFKKLGNMADENYFIKCLNELKGAMTKS